MKKKKIEVKPEVQQEVKPEIQPEVQEHVPEPVQKVERRMCLHCNYIIMIGNGMCCRYSGYAEKLPNPFEAPEWCPLNKLSD